MPKTKPFQDKTARQVDRARELLEAGASVGDTARQLEQEENLTSRWAWLIVTLARRAIKARK